MAFGKKLGKFFKGLGKKVQKGYEGVRSFGKKVMKGLDDIGVGDIARDVGKETLATARAEAERQGVPVGRIEETARRAMTAEGRRGLVREGA